MHKVITISLNGSAYQVEEGGHDALSAYLERARTRLAENPDREEIMRDLEQAVAEKLGRFLSAHKSVVTSAEVAEAIAEMGPVNPAPGDESTTGTGPAPAAGAGVKQLYRIAEGARLAGVANGLAAYFNIDVTLVRVIFVLLTILTGGGWIVAYIAMMIIVPRAETPEQVSRAYGTPWNAQDVMDRARSGFADMRSNAYRWKQERRQWRRAWKAEMRKHKWEARHAYGYHRCHGSVIGFIFQCLFLALIVWAVYHYIPSTQPFWHHVGARIQTAWAWLNAKVTH